MNLKDEVFTDNFPEYRKREIAEGARIVSLMIKNGENIDYVRGALDMLRRIINIPAQAAKLDEEKEYIRNRIDLDFAQFEIDYLRKAVRDE